MRGKGPYPYPCPECGETVNATAAYQARHRNPCRACIRIRNGWTCRACGSSDPSHPSPCPQEVSAVTTSAPSGNAAVLSDAERLAAVHEFHRSWGDQETDSLDVLDLWEQLGRLLGVNP